MRAYVVWVPVLRAGPLEKSSRDESGRIADPRVTQFFDPEGEISKSYASVLRLPKPLPAWDVYLVFGPGVRWPEGQGSGAPPAPTYWMHQLGRAAPPDLRLDGNHLANVTEGILLSAKK